MIQYVDDMALVGRVKDIQLLDTSILLILLQFGKRRVLCSLMLVKLNMCCGANNV